jgi:two-component system sensor histidine kinase/response regulator
MAPELKANILIVNDRPEQLMTLEVLLASLQQNVIIARSGKEALRQVAASQHAVILLDIRMPEMDGFETATLIRQRKESEHTPIIFVTAFGQDELDLSRCYSLGGVDFVQTPIVPQILRAKVGVFIELFKKTQKIEQQAIELRERLAELTEINRELEAFTYSLSHDLRGPLRAIQGFTRMVLEDSAEELGEGGKELLNRVVLATDRMQRLMQDLLAFSRVSRQELRRESVDAEKLLQEIVNEQPSLQPPRANINIQCPLLSIRGDRASLTQCFTNLLSNAVKFVPQGVVPHVRIYSQKIGDKVRLWIEDNGIGIQRGAHLKIFEIFQRLPQNTHYEGEGVGLAIVRRAVERMGGKVGVESEPGKGSRFWIELPEASPKGDLNSPSIAG